MNKTLVNFLIDSGLLVIVAALLFNAAVLRLVFPSPEASAGWTLWGVALLIVIVNVPGVLAGLAYLSIQGPAN